MTGNHRSHGHPIAKGARLDRLMAEPLGRADGRTRLDVGRVAVLTASFDHRVFDGAYCAAFLGRSGTWSSRPPTSGSRHHQGIRRAGRFRAGPPGGRFRPNLRDDDVSGEFR
ncbi:MULTISPECIES: hypothetical protein [unclassified Micromonospora]|uniref:hypothetical protein n=1 Tax=unclassified Micromonospora TaxID=2617518 RepID=UPI003A8642B4